jgi:hypothetical protein
MAQRHQVQEWYQSHHQYQQAQRQHQQRHRQLQQQCRLGWAMSALVYE